MMRFTCAVLFLLARPTGAEWTYKPDAAAGTCTGTFCGPANWNEEFPPCAEVGTQSPINALCSTLDTPLAGVGIDQLTWASPVGGCLEAESELNDHTTEVKVKGCTNAFVTNWKGEAFNLVQYHWHAPSEHTVDGKYYHMEVHHVHNNTLTGQILVHAVFMSASTTLEAECAEGIANVDCSRALFFDKLQKNMPLAAPFEGNIFSANVSFDPYTGFIPPITTHFYQYIGSFTTPGCITNVVWILNPTPVTIFESTLTLYRTNINNFKGNKLAVAAIPRFVSTGSSDGRVRTWNAALGVNNRPIQALTGAKDATRTLNMIGKRDPAVDRISKICGRVNFWDSSASSIEATSSASSLSSSASSESELSGSQASSGSFRSGSSGFYMALWKWIVLLALLGLIAAVVATMGGKKKPKKKSKAAPKPEPKAEEAPLIDLPPLMPMMPMMAAPMTTAVMPSYSMAQAMPVQTYAAPMTTSYAAAPMATAAYPATIAYAAPSYGYAGQVV